MRWTQLLKSLARPVGIDTSVLVAAEKQGGVEQLLPLDDGPFYIPALAATEFLVGIHPPVRADLRQRATQLYHKEFRSMVSVFSEADAAQFAALIAELKTKGQLFRNYSIHWGASAARAFVASSAKTVHL